MKIQVLLQTLVGTGGRYLRGKWSPEEILHRLVKSADVYVSRTVAVHVINGQTPFRRTYTKIYRNNGIDLLEKDLKAFVKGYHSTAMVRDIHARIHMAVEASEWSPEQIAALDEYYIVDDPSRDQIAIYIAHVMYAIICS